MSKIRVMIADDHAVLRGGLRMLINAQADMDVVGEVGNAAECLALGQKLTPDVVLLDLSMPGGSGIKAIEGLRKSGTAIRVLVLTMHAEPAYVRAALAAGASGYVTKDASPDEIIAAIRSLWQGRTYVAVPMEESRFDSVFGDVMATAPKGSPSETPKLSVREREVLVLVARGFTSKEAAEQLHLSVKTVESYRSRFADKLGLRRRADLVRYALEAGLLEEEDHGAP